MPADRVWLFVELSTSSGSDAADLVAQPVVVDRYEGGQRTA